LCLEYQKYEKERDDSYMFIFEGWRLSESDIKNIKLQESEIKSFKFLELKDIKNKVLPKMFKRIEKSLEALRNNSTTYYETIYKS